MGKNIWIVGLMIIVFLIGGYIVYRSSQSVLLSSNVPQIIPISTPNPSPTLEPLPTPTIFNQASPSAIPQNVVKVTGLGFSPKVITIKLNQPVTWINQDTAAHQISSDPHPSHTQYPPLNTVGLLNPGSQKSLTFPTAGTYSYHDHLNPSSKGQIIVK